MDNYLVTFVFDVDADSPEEAARTAKALAQTDPDFWPSSATARGTRGPQAEIDLADDVAPGGLDWADVCTVETPCPVRAMQGGMSCNH